MAITEVARSAADLDDEGIDDEGIEFDPEDLLGGGDDEEEDVDVATEPEDGKPAPQPAAANATPKVRKREHKVGLTITEPMIPRMRIVVVRLEEDLRGEDGELMLPAEGEIAEQVASSYRDAGLYVRVKRHEGKPEYLQPADGGEPVKVYTYESVQVWRTEPERTTTSRTRKTVDLAAIMAATQTGIASGKEPRAAFMEAAIAGDMPEAEATATWTHLGPLMGAK